jgi:hypothetical protein
MLRLTRIPILAGQLRYISRQLQADEAAHEKNAQLSPDNFLVTVGDIHKTPNLS